MKKGQISLFVVLGIVIVVVIAAGIYFSSNLSKSLEEIKLAERNALSLEEKEIAGVIDACIEFTLLNAVIDVSSSGGYYPYKEGSIEYLSFKVPLFFYL